MSIEEAPDVTFNPWMILTFGTLEQVFPFSELYSMEIKSVGLGVEELKFWI